MKFSIKHEIKGRIRVHLHQNRMSFEQADTLLYYLTNNQYVTNAKVFERTADAAIYFVGDRGNIIEALRKFAYENVDVPAAVLETGDLTTHIREKWLKKSFTDMREGYFFLIR